MAWFSTYADETHPKIALAVSIRGSSTRIKGPLAASVAGHIDSRLREQNYLWDSMARPSVTGLTSAN